jgi:hypothetical protein
MNVSWCSSFHLHTFKTIVEMKLTPLKINYKINFPSNFTYNQMTLCLPPLVPVSLVEKHWPRIPHWRGGCSGMLVQQVTTPLFVFLLLLVLNAIFRFMYRWVCFKTSSYIKVTPKCFGHLQGVHVTKRSLTLKI